MPTSISTRKNQTFEFGWVIHDGRFYYRQQDTGPTHTHTCVRLHVQERRQQKENSSERRQIPKASRPFLDFAQFKIRFLSLLLRLFSILTHLFGCTFSQDGSMSFFFLSTNNFPDFKSDSARDSFQPWKYARERVQESGVRSLPTKKQIVEFSRAHTHFRLLLINEHDEFDYVFQPRSASASSCCVRILFPNNFTRTQKTTEKYSTAMPNGNLVVVVVSFPSFSLFPALADRQAGH